MTVKLTQENERNQPLNPNTLQPAIPGILAETQEVSFRSKMVSLYFNCFVYTKVKYVF
jgi:hypothetical protein